MNLELIKAGPYKGQYRSKGGIIFNEGEAKARYPDEVKQLAEKKAVKNRTKK